MKAKLEQEVSHLKLGDRRRSKRFEKIVSRFVNSPSSSISQRGYDWSEIKGSYRFFNNEHVKESALMEGISKATHERCVQNEVVLCIQDTTDVAFDSSAEGLGYLDHGLGKGLMAHNILAIDSWGCPLGLLHQNIWARDHQQMGKTGGRRQRPVNDKESYRWLQGVKDSEHLLSDCKKMISIADREADIYELFALLRAPNSELLIRARHDRKTLLGNKMWAEVEQQALLAQFDLQVGHPRSEESRVAKMSIRAAMLVLAPPCHKEHLPAIFVYGLLVREESDCAAGKPLEWMLVTSMRVDNAQMAMQLVKWYSYRWRIERFHYILKSGCRLEVLQLHKVAALRKAIILYSLCAFKLMQLLYESRINADQPATNFLSEQECQVAYTCQYKAKLVQNLPLSLAKAVWLIARMGGYIGRNNDGPPGIKTLWRGLQKLQNILQFNHIVASTYPHSSSG